MILNILWNKEERRLRAFWRLLIQTLLLVLFTGIVSWAAIAIGITWLGVDLSLFMKSDGSMNLDVLAENDLTVVALITVASLIGVLASVWLAGKVLDRRNFADFGLHLNRKWWEDFSLVYS
jgi:predicted MFS family arabinose efflux permease